MRDAKIAERHFRSLERSVDLLWRTIAYAATSADMVSLRVALERFADEIGVARAERDERVEGGVLPDGSGFAVVSVPLPSTHWIYEDTPPPPMPWREGKGSRRDELAAQVSDAARYAIRASTRSGKDIDFDPDAMVQNFVIGLLGYWTKDGRSHV